MTGSLIFFLINAFYRGDYDGRLTYILGLYTLATVLIARIAIESGRSYANLFSIPLAIVSLIAITRFVQFSGPLAGLSLLINAGLLAIAWFLADRITWDCTWLDPQQHGVQQGLLQSVFKRPFRLGRQQHNPGIWVLYFALLAIPIFGLGQLTIQNEEARRRVITYLVVYFISATALLVTTNIIGMRRYLRHKRVHMPTEMATTWLSWGIGGAMLIVLLCLVLPSSQRGSELLRLSPLAATSLTQWSSRFGWGGETGQGTEPTSGEASIAADNLPEDAPGGPSKSDPDQANREKKSGSKQDSKPTESQSKSDELSNAETDRNDHPTSPPADRPQNEPSEKPSEQPNSRSRDSSQAQAGDQQPAPTESDNSQEPEQSPTQEGQSQSPAATPRVDLSGWRLPRIGRWLIIAVLLVVICVYGLIHRAEVAAMWRHLREFLAGLFARKVSAHPNDRSASTTRSQNDSARRPFSSYANPFRTPPAGWSNAQLVQYTFVALEAWSTEHSVERDQDQTAMEFVRRLRVRFPEIGPPAAVAAELLDGLMFGGQQPHATEMQNLAQLWQLMESS
jgi:hypothetical protein